MRAVWGVSILAFVTVSACGRREPPSAEPKDVEGAAPDVNVVHGDFIAALKKSLWSDADGFETCVLDPGTTVYRDDREEKDPDRWEEFLWRFPALRRDTYDSFWSANERARPIAPLDRGAMKLHVLTKAEDAELEAIAEGARFREYWDTFRARYGKAVRVRLSAVGFSEDRRQAVIYYSASFDFLAAWGSCCLLKREGDRWEIAEEHYMWIS